MLPRRASGTAAFRLILLGQSLAMVGSGLTSFALSVWAYQVSRSATQFALVAACSLLPGVLLSPLAGAFIDRSGPRRAMALGNLATAAGAAVLAVVTLQHGLRLSHVYVVAAVTSALGSFCWPAFGAATTVLVPERDFAKASGAAQLGDSAAQLFSPALGGLLVGVVGLPAVLSLELLSSLMALACLLMSAVPSAIRDPLAMPRRSVWREALDGCSYLSRSPALIALVGLAAVMDLTVSFLEVLSAPIVLALSSSAVLGTIRSVAGAGMVAGSLAMSIWGAPERRVVALSAAQGLVGAHVILMGLTTTPWLLGAAGFGALFFIALVNGCAQTLWQTNTPPELQGRVFALRRFSALSRPAGYLLAGALADRVLEPFMQDALVGSIAQRLVGVGPGRGSALLLASAGLLTIFSALLAYRSRPLRELDGFAHSRAASAAPPVES
jgi:DHA3 family macrolide efflux protein-like MFS transporter